MEWIKKPGVKKGLKVFGYVLFGLWVFVWALVWTFPSGRLKAFIEQGLQRVGYQARIDRVSLTGLGSLSLEGISLVVSSDPKREGQEGKGEREIRVEKVKASFSLLPLLFKKVKAWISVFNGGGVFGPVRVSMDGDKLDVAIQEVQNFALPEGLGFSGIRFKGVLDGKGTVSVGLKEGLTSGVGRLDLSAKDVVAVKPVLRHKTQGSLELSDVKLGTVRLSLVLDKRSNIQALKKERKVGPKDETVIHFEKAEVDGEDVKVVVEGQSTIRLIEGRPLMDAQLNVELAFSLSDAFFEREVKGEGGTTKPNKALKTLLELDPGFRTANVGGYYGLICTGTLRAPSCIPKRPSIRGGDFRPPQKPEDKGEQEAKKASQPQVSPQQVQQGTGAQKQVEVQKPVAPVVTGQPPVPPAPPTPVPQEKPPEPAIQQVPPPREIPSVERAVTLPQKLVPTIIGRPKLLIRGGGEGEEGEGQEQPAPATEPAPAQE